MAVDADVALADHRPAPPLRRRCGRASIADGVDSGTRDDRDCSAAAALALRSTQGREYAPAKALRE